MHFKFGSDAIASDIAVKYSFLPRRHKFINKMQKHNMLFTMLITAAVAQWVRAFALQAEGWVFESQPRQT